MTQDQVIAAARESGFIDRATFNHQQELERFYAIAFAQGMERAAEICDRLAGVTAKWPEASEGLTAETKFVRGFGDCMATFGEEIRAEAHAKNQPESTHDTGNV